MIYNLNNMSLKVNFIDCVSPEKEVYDREHMQYLEEMAIKKKFKSKLK